MEKLKKSSDKYVLLLSNMYPSRKHPAWGIFVYNQVRELEKGHGLKLKLVVSYDKPRGLLPKIKKYICLHMKAWMSVFTSFNLVHLHYASAAHLIAASPVLFLRRKPLVITIHRGEIYSLPEKGLSKAIVQSFLHSSDHIIAVSNDLKYKLIKKLGLPSKKISIISVGCDLSVFIPFLPSEKKEAKMKVRLPLNKTVILYVGSIDYRKGLDVLFDALNKLEDLSSMIILIIGSGPIRRELESTDTYKILKGHVRWLGEKTHEELPLWFAAADVFVLPSRSEGTPTVLLEAMASGTPIIASRVGGIPELISNEVNGFLFDSENSDQLKNCLKIILNNRELCERIAQKALIDIKEHSLHRQIERIIDIYRTLLSTI